MYGYSDFYEEEIYEPTPLDELFVEYREKCKTILLASVQGEIDMIKERNGTLETANDELSHKLRICEDKLKDKDKQIKDCGALSYLLNKLQKEENEIYDEYKKRVFRFFEAILKSDFNVDYNKDTDIGVLLLTKYYYQKQIVVDILKTLNMSSNNKDYSKFKLPIDWSEETLDYFFENCDRLCNTNSWYFDNHNLEYYHWRSKKECALNGSIPLQYLFLNPLIRKDKYLKAIGKNVYRNNYVNKYEFLEIVKYQDLSKDEIKIILDNMDLVAWNKSHKGISSFVLDNLDLIEDRFQEKAYGYFKNSYEFQYSKKILSLPFKYIKMWTKDYPKEMSEWLTKCKKINEKRNQPQRGGCCSPIDEQMEKLNNLTTEQKRELMEIILLGE